MVGVGLLESIVESAGVGMALVRGPDLVIEMANAAYRALSPFREMLGRPFEAVWPEAAERVLPVLNRTMQTGAPFDAVDMRVDIRRTAGGPLEEAYFSFGCRRLEGRPGEPAAVLVHVLDTTSLVLARRRAEERAQGGAALLGAEQAAREQAERARGRFEMLSAMTAAMNAGAELDAVLGTALQRAVSLFGADDGALALVEEGGTSLCTFVEMWERGRTGRVASVDGLTHVREAAESGRAVFLALDETEGEERARFQRVGIGSSLIVPLVDGGICFGILSVNWKEARSRPPPEDMAFAEAMAHQCALAITRAWVLESEKSARAAAEGMSRIQEMLGAVLAHDLRNPITAIGINSMALLARGGLDHRQAEAVGRIGALARRMGTLVAELLDYARVRQRGGIAVEPQRTDIQAICAGAIRQQLDAHPGRRVEFRLSGAGEGQWDSSRLEQVVANLVGNALDRCPEDAPVEVTAVGAEDHLVLEVHNEGTPIPSESLETIFEPFRRTDRKGSIGLGLYIVKEIVRAHGGDIAVTSNQADGTRFTLRLPRFAPARAPAPTA